MGRPVSEDKVGDGFVPLFLKQITECDSQMISKKLESFNLFGSRRNKSTTNSERFKN